MNTINQTKPWTAQEIDTLKSLYPHTNTEDIALVIDRSYSAICHKAHKLKLTKTEKFFQNRRLSGRFVKRTSLLSRVLNFLRLRTC